MPDASWTVSRLSSETLEIDSSGSRIRARTPQTKSVLLPYDEVIEWGLKADPDGWLDIDEVRGGETRMITMTAWALPSQKSLGWHGHDHVLGMVMTIAWGLCLRL